MTDRRILAAAGGARIAAWVFALFVLLSAARGAALPEPGPEDGGLRLRLVVEPRPRADKEGFDVRIDLVNISDRAVTLRSGWQADESGGVKDYLEAATSIECEAAIAPCSVATAKTRATLISGFVSCRRTTSDSEWRRSKPRPFPSGDQWNESICSELKLVI